MSKKSTPLKVDIVQKLDHREEDLITTITRALNLMTPAERVKMFANLRPNIPRTNDEWLINTAAVLGFAIATSVARTAGETLCEHVKGN